MNQTGLKRVLSVKRLLMLGITASALIFTSSCGNEKNIVSDVEIPKEAATGESWTIMVYMSGGGDEYLHGTASAALEEMTEVSYPENINLLVQTGGSFGWQAGGIDSNYLDRFMVQEDSLRLMERSEQRSMAESVSLTDFIDWCEDTAPANHYALIIYGSGANSAYGMAHDEMYDNKSLTLTALSKAIYNADAHFDIIGFDSDLAASAEAATLLSTSADYLVASQEYMAENGWNYKGWLNYIKENPTSSVLDVAKAVCDTYMDKCRKDNADEMATMSVVQLSEITGLSQSIEGMAGELGTVSESLSDYSVVSGEIPKTMCFGANTVNEGYSNMLDLNDLAVKLSSGADKTSGRIQEELEKSVVYNVKGKYRSEACGLSIFYPLNESSDELPKYMDICPFKRYSEFIASVSANADVGSNVSVKFNDTDAYNDYVTERDRMQYTVVPGDTGIELNMVGNMDIVRNVSQRVFKKSDVGYLYLGDASEIDENKKAGIYKTKNSFNFPLMNGNSVSFNLVYAGENYSIYSIPLKVDGNVKNLRVAAEKKTDGTMSYVPLSLHESLGAGSKYSRYVSPLRIYNLVVPLFREYSTGEVVEGKAFKTWPFGLHLKGKTLPDGSYRTDYRVMYIYGNAFNTEYADFDFSENTIAYK